MRRLLFLPFAFLFLLAFPTPIEAASLYLSPSGGTIGSSTSIQVRLNTGGEGINGVSAYLSYPTDKLEAIGISYGGSFSIAAEGAYGGGFVNISRGSFSGVSGDVNIATVRFRAKTLGTATISFRGGSAAARATDSSNALGATSAGTYNLAPGQGGTSTDTGSTKTTPTKGPTDESEPVITNIKVTKTATNSASIVWKTDDASDSTVEFGLEEKRYFLSQTDSKLVTDHNIVLESPLFEPGLQIHFRVKSKNASGKESVGKNDILQLIGYKVKVLVLDNNNNPVPNATVLFYSVPRKTVTDSNGEAIFENVSPGKHVIFVKLQNQAMLREITVSEIDTPQTLTIKITTLSVTDAFFSRVSPAAIGGAGAVLIAVGLGVVFAIRRKRTVAI
ncbi:MAG: carboxypeptidase regulatory-like domain-containing protein [Candidatus Levybacteria bacterium]|nr:carboxypeptidase regulatory-like domain-containing protein [Candidatus Levybacteria bacterium]